MWGAGLDWLGIEGGRPLGDGRGWIGRGLRVGGALAGWAVIDWLWGVKEDVGRGLWGRGLM